MYKIRWHSATIEQSQIDKVPTTAYATVHVGHYRSEYSSTRCDVDATICAIVTAYTIFGICGFRTVSVHVNQTYFLSGFDNNKP